MARGGRSQLSTQADVKTLAPRSLLTPITLADHLNAEACEGAWRLIELASLSNLPFQAELRWSGGRGAGANVRFTVSRGTRICVFARTLTVRTANLAAGDSNQVVVSVPDGYADTQNQFEEEGSGEQGDSIPIDIPPFAQFVRIGLAIPTAYSNVNVELVDGLGTVRESHQLDQQPGGNGIPIGAATQMRLNFNTSTEYRVVFVLAL